MFKELVKFKKRFGHCHVRTGWNENRALARCVIKKRADKQAGLLRPERGARLVKLGFV